MDSRRRQYPLLDRFLIQYALGQPLALALKLGSRETDIREGELERALKRDASYSLLSETAFRLALAWKGCP